MGLFDKLFKKGNKVYSPLKGKLIKLSEVNDPTFSEGILGKGVAVIPTDGALYAPFDGTVAFVANTKHALSLTSTNETELLIHVGLDTVKLDGKGYDVKVNNGDTFKKGDLLMTIDLDFIKSQGYDIVTPVIVCNPDAYKDVVGINEGREVNAGDEIISLL